MDTKDDEKAAAAKSVRISKEYKKYKRFLKDKLKGHFADADKKVSLYDHIEKLWESTPVKNRKKEKQLPMNCS